MSPGAQRLFAGHGDPGALTFHSMGGLGNQLFIYAAGRAASQVTALPLRLDTSLHAQRPDRPFLLQALGLDVDVTEVVPRPARRLARRVVSDQPPRGCSYQEVPFVYDEELYRRRAGECAFGYFQCYQYVEAVAGQLRVSFDELAQRRLDAHTAAVEQVESPGSIVLHVRRGDYLAPGAVEFHGLAPAAYYRSAVTLLRRLGHDGPVLLFSDDLAGAQDELADLGAQPAMPAGADAVDEMLVMSRASALVTANSSFSWWAGWIGDRPDRPVISPRPWFDDRTSHTRDLLPPHWLTLDRRIARG